MSELKEQLSVLKTNGSFHTEYKPEYIVTGEMNENCLFSSLGLHNRLM